MCFCGTDHTGEFWTFWKVFVAVYILIKRMATVFHYKKMDLKFISRIILVFMVSFLFSKKIIWKYHLTNNNNVKRTVLKLPVASSQWGRISCK